MKTNDAHCHFFSRNFFQALALEKDIVGPNSIGEASRILGWAPPGSSRELADCWVQELDLHNVARAALISSVLEDEESVAEAVARYPQRFVGYFMVDPTRPSVLERAERAVVNLGLRCACLFPGMHRYELSDKRAACLVY